MNKLNFIEQFKKQLEFHGDVLQFVSGGSVFDCRDWVIKDQGNFITMVKDSCIDGSDATEYLCIRLSSITSFNFHTVNNNE